MLGAAEVVASCLPSTLSWTSLGVVAWGDAYVKERYGSWQAALAHSYANGWY